MTVEDDQAQIAGRTLAGRQPEKIAPEEIVDALRRSGYPIEYRLEQKLRERPWAVFPNMTFADPFTGKPRELDISAVAANNISRREFLFTELLVECVNNPQPIAFFTRDDQAPNANIYSIPYSGVPIKVYRGTGKKPRIKRLADFIEADDFHHYCSDVNATQYCSFLKKKGQKEWLALHEDTHFECFQKLCMALENELDDHARNTRLVEDDHINIQTYYPIVVVGGDLLEVAIDGDEFDIRETQHVQFVQSHTHKGINRSCHIDVVTEAQFPQLVEQIEREVEETASRLSKKKKTLRHSVDQIYAETKGVTDFEVLKEKLGYGRI